MNKNIVLETEQKVFESLYKSQKENGLKLRGLPRVIETGRTNN
jgi:hypothetical protein